MVSFLSGVLPEVVEVQVFQYRLSNIMILIGQKVAFQHITGSFFLVTSLSIFRLISLILRVVQENFLLGRFPTTKIHNTFQTKGIRDCW